MLTSAFVLKWVLEFDGVTISYWLYTTDFLYFIAIDLCSTFVMRYWCISIPNIFELKIKSVGSQANMFSDHLISSFGFCQRFSYFPKVCDHIGSSLSAQIRTVWKKKNIRHIVSIFWIRNKNTSSLIHFFDAILLDVSVHT